MRESYEKMADILQNKFYQTLGGADRSKAYAALKKLPGFTDFNGGSGFYTGGGGCVGAAPMRYYNYYELPSQGAKIEVAILYPIANAKGDLTIMLEATLRLQGFFFKMQHHFRYQGGRWKMVVRTAGRGIPVSLRKSVPKGYRTRIRNKKPFKVYRGDPWWEWAIDEFIRATHLPHRLDLQASSDNS